jgi:uncharacterized protein
MKSFRTALASTLALLLAAPALATEPPKAGSGATPPDSRTEAPMVDADPAIWVVKDDDTTIYLFGTVHILKPGLSWFDEAIADAFAESDELVTELPKVDEAEMGAAMMQAGMDTTGTPLRSRMNEAQKKAYETALAGMGLPPEAFDAFEPWMAALTLSIMPLMAQGYDLNSGVEKVLEEKVAMRTPAMPRKGLETLAEQLGIFDTLPMDEQTAYLSSVIDQLPKLTATIDTMVERWAKGDVDGLAAVMNSGFEGNEKLYKALLADRNARWASWIKARMDKPGTVFVAVGAGHLAGKDSVQDYIAKDGLKAERISY